MVFQGLFSMLAFTTSSGLSLNVTEGHPMLIKDQGKLVKKAASDIAIGDIVLDSTAANGSTIEKVDKFEKEGKVLVFTDECSMLANGILVAVDCSVDSGVTAA